MKVEAELYLRSEGRGWEPAVTVVWSGPGCHRDSATVEMKLPWVSCESGLTEHFTGVHCRPVKNTLSSKWKVNREAISHPLEKSVFKASIRATHSLLAP